MAFAEASTTSVKAIFSKLRRNSLFESPSCPIPDHTFDVFPKGIGRHDELKTFLFVMFPSIKNVFVPSLHERSQDMG